MDEQTQTNTIDIIGTEAAAKQAAALGKDLLAAVLITSLVANLFAFSAWMAVTLSL